MWDEWVLFKKNAIKITISALITPLLYMIAFGFGVTGGTSLYGITYLKFLIPGIVALTTMNASYKAVSVKLLTNRVHDLTFEHYLVAPISIAAFCLGKTLAGAIRGMYAGILILLIGRLFGIQLNITVGFLGVMFLNGMTFASLGMYAAMIATSHSDLNRFGSYVLLPMTFLCGTFFKTTQLPSVIREVVSLLPLTHTSMMLRSIASYEAFSVGSIGIILAYFGLFFILTYRKCLSIAM
jgi:ABC-type multidrug transport system permease subunit